MFKNRKKIIEAITCAIDPRSPAYQKALSKYPQDYGEYFFLHDMSNYVKEALVVEKQFENAQGYFISNGGNGYVGFYAHDAAIGLLQHAIATGSPDAAVSWLEKVISINPENFIDGCNIMVLGGIEVSDQVKLDTDIILMPFDKIPNSSRKKTIDLGNIKSLGNFSITPKAALVLQSKVKNSIFPISEESKYSEESKHFSQEAMNTYDRIDKYRIALTVLGPSSPLNVGYWFQYNDKDIDDAFGIHASISYSMVEVIPSIFSKPYAVTNNEAIKKIVNSFYRLNNKFQPQCRLALERLNQAMRRRLSLGDKAIDLAIALEILLADNGENTYKIALRGALLLDGSQEDQLKTRAIIGGLYSLRSAVVHSGKIPNTINLKEYGKKKIEELLKEAEVITAKIIISLMKRGNIPDWYSFEMFPDKIDNSTER